MGTVGTAVPRPQFHAPRVDSASFLRDVIRSVKCFRRKASFWPLGWPRSKRSELFFFFLRKGGLRATCKPREVRACSLSEAGRRKGKRLQCRRSLCQEAFFCCCLFQVALRKAPGGVHATQCVCEMTTERYLAFKRFGFLEQQTTVSSFFLKYSFRRAMLQLEFRGPNQNPKNRTLNSHRVTGGTRCVLWEVTMYGHLPLTKLGFLPVPLWPIFLLKCSLRRAMLQLEFR